MRIPPRLRRRDRKRGTFRNSETVNSSLRPSARFVSLASDATLRGRSAHLVSCTKCHAQIAEGSTFCSECGHQQTATLPPPYDIYCSKCGQPLHPAQKAAKAAEDAGFGVKAVQAAVPDNAACALCYLFGWVTGIAFLLTDKRRKCSLSCGAIHNHFWHLESRAFFSRALLGKRLHRAIALRFGGDVFDRHPRHDRRGPVGRF